MVRRIYSGPLIWVASILFLSMGCRAPVESSRGATSELKWGIHASGKYANLINLKPNQSVEVCAPTKEWEEASHQAIQQWSTAIGRWGHFKINNCNSGSDVRINMSGFSQTGLNYFTQNPGRILIQSNATGNFLKAVILHEFGHSFGLCDQYTDVGSANCSSSRSDRQQNSEIMGATSSNKLLLTPGDITGVQKLADSKSIPANAAWDAYLASQPQPDQSGQNMLFAKFVEPSGAGEQRILLSVPVGQVPALCLEATPTSANSSASTCSSTAVGFIPVSKSNVIGDRDIYSTTASLPALSKATRNVFSVSLSQGQQTSSVQFAAVSTGI